VILDSSAVVAIVAREPGFERLAPTSRRPICQFWIFERNSTALAKEWVPALWKRWRKLRGSSWDVPARNLPAAALSAVLEIQ